MKVILCRGNRVISAQARILSEYPVARSRGETLSGFEEASGGRLGRKAIW